MVAVRLLQKKFILAYEKYFQFLWIKRLEKIACNLDNSVAFDRYKIYNFIFFKNYSFRVSKILEIS